MISSASDLVPQAQLASRLQALAGQLSPQDLHWASGYLAGMAAASNAAPASVPPTAAPQAALTIWYGSQTGNARRLAETLASEAQTQGMLVDLASLADIKPRSIERVRFLVLVVSTHGDGEPPEDAEAMLDWLRARPEPSLKDLQYAVFALGDSSYPQFCQTGHDFQRALEDRGAEALLELGTADIDIERSATPWRDQVLDRVAPLLDTREQASAATYPPLQMVATPAVVADRDKPVAIEVLEIAPLTVSPANNAVQHVALDLAASGLRYQAGDALGVWPENPHASVDELLEQVGLDGETAVSCADHSRLLREWLLNHREITRISRGLIEDYQQRVKHSGLAELLDDAAALAAWCRERQVIDLLREFPGPLTGSELVELLRPLSPRLYSIASGPDAEPGEVHLTVATVGGMTERGLRAGAASWWLNRQLKPGDQARVWVEPNPRFRLPDSATTPIIMVGAGTGVAPFRAFLQQREASGDSGHNWLIFGNRLRRSDFLYQLEWQRWLKVGVLNQLNAVFSRDATDATQRYVQHALAEHGEQVYRQLRDGAHIYVCGATAMAAGVHQVLLDIGQTHGGQTPDQATIWLRELRSAKRYQKDVY